MTIFEKPNLIIIIIIILNAYAYTHACTLHIAQCICNAYANCSIRMHKLHNAHYTIFNAYAYTHACTLHIAQYICSLLNAHSQIAHCIYKYFHFHLEDKNCYSKLIIDNFHSKRQYSGMCCSKDCKDWLFI